jgi:uncharacterized protein YbcC (UPF0753/DUF2309 family)
MTTSFNEKEVLNRLRHFLPEQAPLKDFVHHNTLHAFQKKSFFDAISSASKKFGYKVSLSIEEYRELYKNHRIREDILEDRVIKRKGQENADEWVHRLFNKNYDDSNPARVGKLRANWKDKYDIDLDAETHLLLFKLLSGYLDQGISIWKFPVNEGGFLATLHELEDHSATDFVRTKKGRELLANRELELADLLKILVGDESLYEQYLFDQQFSHPGWSGLVSVIETKPHTLLDYRKITLRGMIYFELILEIDALEHRFGNKWKPLAENLTEKPAGIFEPIEKTEEDEVISIWQEAFEWTYYDEVLAGIQKMKGNTSIKTNKTFQALFCIDDREGSIRRNIEKIDNKCETYGTPGHFNLDFYFQPKKGKFLTKVCPGSVNPKYLIKEIGDDPVIKKDIHFSKATHHFILGYFYSLIIGFWSGFQMFLNIFKPSLSPGASSSFSHMGTSSQLSIENKGKDDIQDGLQIGYTIDEMIERVNGVLKSIGLVHDFGKVVYIIGHGASSINNTHYAGYDCGACSGRPGSVNARAFSFMANHPKVRTGLKSIGIVIPDSTQFLGGIHDTTRDEFLFFDGDVLSETNRSLHLTHLKTFDQALDMNAKERSRRFASINSKQPAKGIHDLVRNRSVSLFEPRPELNHATNALCIVGRHSLHEGLFLDRRAFSNSYDYSLDPNGDLLLNILNAAAPVCGGINLEYYFSRVDNQKLGAGSKLPHNVVGLIGVSNGVEGDLRPGLPLQMIEVHDPIRLMMIVEHYPEVVLDTIEKNKSTYEWFQNEWLILTVIHPETYDIYHFHKGKFEMYQPFKKLLDTIDDLDKVIESHAKNLPVYLIKN